MKKKMYFMLIAGMLLTAFPIQVLADETDDRIAEIKKEISALQNELKELEALKSNSGNTETKNGKVEIIAEYTLSDGLDWCTLHYYVVKNNSDTTVDITTSSQAFSSDGTMLAEAEGTLNALGSGCTSIFCESFETNEPIDSYKTDLKETPSEYFESVIQDLSFVQTKLFSGAVFEVTNNGTEPAEFVEGCALFFQGDSLVDCGSAYFMDTDSELKPGEDISEEIRINGEYDRIEFYLKGRR